MLFGRRNKPKAHHRVRDFFWPRKGWRRAWRYVVHRVRRMPGTPYAIAAGFACGAAVSMTPLPGFHFILAGLCAWALRGSILASAIGTMVGNPWTFPFIWFWTYKSGNWLLGSPHGILASEITMGYLLDHPGRVLLPMVVGCIPLAMVTWLVFFWGVRRMVTSYQINRHHRIAKARQAAVRKAPGINEAGSAE